MMVVEQQIEEQRNHGNVTILTRSSKGTNMN